MDWSQVTVKDVLKWASDIPDKRLYELLKGIEGEIHYREVTRKERYEILGEIKVINLDEGGDWECPNCWAMNLGKGNKIGDVVECDKVIGCGNQFIILLP